MSPEREEPTEEHEELYEEVPPRSIFSAVWFRVVLILIVLGVIGAVAVPYVLDWTSAPPPARTASKTPAPAAPQPSTTPAAPIEKPAAPAEKKDTTLIPAPAPPAETKSIETKPIETKPAEPKAAPTKPAPSATAKAPAEPKPAAKPAPETKPAPAAKPPAASKPAVESKSPAPEAKSATVPAETKPKAAEPAKSAAPATATKPSTPVRTAAKATPTPATATGPYWVQVGAFKDAETAKKVAARLREDKYSVEESVKRVGGGATAPAASAPTAAKPSGPSSADQYDVYVTGMSAADLNQKLAAKGLAAEPSGAGMVVKPSLPLRDAVALSKDLAVEGFKVQVRRAGSPAAGPAAAAPSPPPAASSGGDELHRVRVGAYPDRAAAQAVVRELEGKGYKPFIARGDQ